MDSARVTRVSAEQIPLFYPRGCAAPPRGITLIATLERFVYCSSELVISGRAPGRSPEGTGNCSSCYANMGPVEGSDPFMKHQKELWKLINGFIRRYFTSKTPPPVTTVK